MSDMQQPQAVERPLHQAPAWVQALVPPQADLNEAHEQARRFLAGDTTIPARVLDDVDDVFDGDHGAA
jgi:hypothetical protein